ncbi:MAG: hypothetical protein H0V93_00565 [Euzebyales bacterium]|nr:hypothetical protein [Euzebyales bacterium]
MSVLERVADLGVDAVAARGLGVAPGTLQLRRVWPRGAEHLLLEYGDATGRSVAGQWFADPERLRAVAAATRRATAAQARAGVKVTAEVLLQAGGADRKLRALAGVLAEPEASLVVHRPERRAVVRLEGPPETYAKVVRPGAVAGVVATGRAAGALPVATPRLLAASDGVTRWSALPGVALHDRLGATDGHLVGRAVRAVHAAPLPAAAQLHDAAAEIAVCDLWLDRLASFDPDLALALRPARPAGARPPGRLLGGHAPAPVRGVPLPPRLGGRAAGPPAPPARRAARCGRRATRRADEDSLMKSSRNPHTLWESCGAPQQGRSTRVR